MDMLPPGVVDAILFWDANPPAWADWALLIFFITGVLSLAWAATRSSPSETLNERLADEVEEARR